MPKHSELNQSRILLLVLSMVFLGACAGPKYEQDYKADTDFSRYQTYAWQGGRAEVEALALERLQTLTREALATQGYQLDQENPDLLVTLNAFTRRKVEGSSGIGLSIGVPLGDRSRIGIGGSKALPREEQEGILVVDLIDADSNQLVWRGTGTGIPLEAFKLAGEQRLEKAIEKLVEPFPPQ